MRLVTGRRRMAVAAISAAALLAAAACSDDGDGDEPTDPDEPITLTVHDFGGNGFGYTELVQQYMSEHPNITIQYETVSERYDDQYRPNVLQQLEAGSAPDIIAIEEQGIGQFTALEGQLVDLGQFGLESREADYPAWKYELGKTADGTLVALGTDVGGMLLCYRTDLFEEAGLPTNRDEVAALWPTWDDYEAVAQDFIDSGVDATFADSINQLWNVRLVQEAGAGDGTSFFDREGNYIAGQSPAVRTAFDFVSRLNEIGAIGTFQNFTPEWNTAQAEGSFATMGCPAWMLGVVEGNSGEENEGNWDVAPVPGGGGNWGGSWLAVTENSENQEAAADLVNFLTSTEGQLGAWEAVSAYPSSPAAQQDPAVADTTNPYFNDAPVGQLIAASIQAYQPVFFGPLHSAVRTEVENVLLEMVQGGISGEDAFNELVAAGQEVVDTQG
jgi:cellobiose transport system substrate-binding protein